MIHRYWLQFALLISLALLLTGCDDGIPRASPADARSPAPNSVSIYAGPNVHWAVRQSVEQADQLRVLGKLGLSDGEAAENQGAWLRVRSLDGVDGWVTGRELDLEASVLSALPEVLAEPVSVRVRAGTRIYEQPQVGDVWREVPATARGWLEGRSADGDWLLTHSVAGVDDHRHGWIAAADADGQAIHAELPVAFASGLWLVPLDNAFTAIQVLPRVGPDSWGWSGPDSIIYLDDDHPYDQRSGTLRRLNLLLRQTEVLAEEVKGRISVSPSGEDVLILPYGPVNAHRQPMALIRDDGVAQEIGSQNTLGTPIPSLRERIRWSDHEAALLSLDRLTPTGSGGEFPVTLHDLDGRSGIELGLAADAVFDADGRSIWLLRGGSLFRIEADGREYEIGLPAPARGGLAPHPGGKLVVIVSEIDSRALLVDARGVVERIWAAERVVWAPGGQRYAYRAVDGWYMASLRSGQRTWLGAIVLDARWSADGRHLALLTRPHRSDGIVSLTPSFLQLRIYSTDGALTTAVRVASCAQIEWSPASQVLAVGGVGCSGE